MTIAAPELKITPEVLNEISRLEMLAGQNRSYARHMERTDLHTGGFLGANHAPCKYWLHVRTAANAQRQLDYLLRKHGLELVSA